MSWKEIAEFKIIGRITAAATVLSGMGMVIFYLTSTTGTIQAEVLAGGAAITASAGTFLFMSEK